MKKVIFSLLLVFSFVPVDLCSNNGFDADIDAQTILSFVKKNKISAEAFKERLDGYPLQNPNIQDQNGLTICNHILSISSQDKKAGYLDAFLEKYVDRMDAKTALYVLKNSQNFAFKDDHKNRMISLAGEGKKFIFTAFCYGLMTPHIKFDLEARRKKMSWPASIAMVAGGISMMWTGIKKVEEIDRLAEKKIGGPVYFASLAAWTGGFVARVVLVNKFQKKFPVLDAFIQKNPKTAFLLGLASSAVSYLALHKTRTTSS